jgi:hypothetical protein
LALLVKADGEVQLIEPADGKRFTAEEIHKYVGGYIELTYTRRTSFIVGGKTYAVFDGQPMFVNEDGKTHHLPINPNATACYQFRAVDCIAGDAVICSEDEVD